MEGGDDSLAALQAALPSVGLQLRRDGEIWLIQKGPLVRDQPAPAATPVSLLAPENVIVTGSRHQFPEDAGTASSRRLAVGDLAATPNLASDPMRAMSRLPGISSVGISAKPRIRGGLQDELLILQDGVELLEPFHLADYHSAYSTLDYYTVEHVDFYTGGFPSRYGNRMSGVMDISNDWAENDYNTNLGISSFSNFIHTRGNFTDRPEATWVASYRRGDLSDLTDYIDSRAGDPEYQDAALRVGLSPGEHSRLTAGLVYSEDDIRFGDIGENAASQIDRWYGWAQFELAFSEYLQTRVSLSGSDFERKKTLANAEIEDDPEDPGSFVNYQQSVKRLTLRADARWLRGPVLHEFGWQLEANSADYDNVGRLDRGELAEIIGTRRFETRDIHLEPDGWSGGAYWAAEWPLGQRWLVQPGVRWDWQGYYLGSGVDHQISPRLGIACDLDEQTRLRLSAGRFYQPEGIHELQALDGITRFYRPQRSDQVIAGVEMARADWRMIIEGYYKRYRDTKGRFENIFNPFVLLPEMEPDRLGLHPDQARAYGLDMDLALAVTPGVTATLRYSYMRAEDRLQGAWTERRWSQRHTANASLLWQKDSFSVGFALMWHSGWRSTLLPEFIAFDGPIDVLDFLNNRELRDHVAIDVSARYAWNLPKARLELYADVSNITDRDNVAGVDFDEAEVEDGYTLTRDSETLLGLVPSVGITLSF